MVASLTENSDARIKRFAAVGLTVMAFCFPISIALSGLTFFPLIGLYVLAAPWTFRIWPPSWGRVESAFAIFWGLSIVSASVGLSPIHSTVRLEKDLYFALVIFLGAYLRKETSAGPRLMRAMAAGGLVTAAFGTLQVLAGINQFDGHGGAFLNLPPLFMHWPKPLVDQLALVNGRATGLRSHPITYAETLLIPLAYLLAVLAQPLPIRKSWWKWACAQIILSLALIFSQSRGPWISYGLMMVALVVLAPLPHVFRRLGFVVLLPVVLLLAVPSLRHRVLSIGDSGFQSNAERVIMWKAGFRMALDRPWLGVGPGNVRLASPRYQTPVENTTYGPWGHLHNTYINCAAERGLLGLGSFLILIAMIVWTLVQSYRSTPLDQLGRRTILLTALLSLIGWLFSGMTEATYNDTSVLMVFYLVMGVALATARNHWRT